MKWLSASGVIVILVAVVYGQVAAHDFISYDDDLYVTRNEVVQAGLTREGLAWAFSTSHTGNWHPLTWVSHMLDVELFGLEPGAHHLSSVVQHALSALVLLFALRAMRLAFWPAVVVAALFAVHPLRVESVAWASERKDVLAGLFFHLTLWAWVCYARRPGALRYALVAVALALGLLAKPILVTLPCVLLLVDLWPLRRWTRLRDGRPGRDERGESAEPWPFAEGSLRRLVLEKLPLLLIVAVSAWMTVRHQQVEGAVASAGALSLATRLSNAAVSVASYVGKAVWPVGLAAFYPHPGLVDPSYTPWSPAALAALVGVVLVTVLVFALLWRRPWITVGWLWTIGILFPVLGLFQVGEQAMADRYAYLALTGLALLVTHETWSRAGGALWIGVAAVVLGACTLLSWRQVATWRDSRTLFEHAVAVTERNYLAHTHLGSAKANAGLMEEARHHYEETLRIRPHYAWAHLYLGRLLLEAGQAREARRHLEEAHLHFPDDASLLYKLGVARDHGGDTQAAERAYREVLLLDSGSTDAHVALAGLEVRRGRVEEGIAHLRRALEIDPEHASARARLDQLQRMRRE